MYVVLLSIVYWLCYPATWLLSFVSPLRPIDMAIRLFFWQPSKFVLVRSIAAHESANFTSKLFKDSCNAFGMGYTPNSPYQNGSSSVKGALGEPQFASYISVFYSVADFYDYAYRRVPAVGKVLNSTPNVDGVKGSDKFTVISTGYYASVLSALKNASYFLAPYVTYNLAVQNFAFANKVRGYHFALAFFLSIFIPSVILWIRAGKALRFRR